jgi:hypothetical protein
VSAAIHSGRASADAVRPSPSSSASGRSAAC